MALSKYPSSCSRNAPPFCYDRLSGPFFYNNFSLPMAIFLYNKEFSVFFLLISPREVMFSFLGVSVSVLYDGGGFPFNPLCFPRRGHYHDLFYWELSPHLSTGGVFFFFFFFFFFLGPGVYIVPQLFGSFQVGPPAGAFDLWVLLIWLARRYVWLLLLPIFTPEHPFCDRIFLGPMWFLPSESSFCRLAWVVLTSHGSLKGTLSLGWCAVPFLLLFPG